MMKEGCTMRYGQLRQYDIANGPGIRATLFVTGCSHHCYNCFNQEYWDHDAGKVFDEKEPYNDNENELKELKNLGKKSLDEIKAVMQEIGYPVGGDLGGGKEQLKKKIADLKSQMSAKE